MAVNEVQLTISVGDNGSLGVVAKKADAAAKSTGRLTKQTGQLGKTSDTTYRTLQGTAGTSSNLTKNFAKQAQGIQGGLVPAYATLAANVFAITAAFGALQRAAQVEQLVAGFTFLGNTAGRTATLVAESLVKITDNALSMEQALRAASTGFSAGFDTSSMERLSQVAKNAATALGRDVGDATDRLIRGVAKLEPEILDELGIFVRLEPAVEKYASSLGKSANTLTETERRQAFLNEALAQGEKKFGDLTGEIGVDPYTKLAAAFNNLAKSFFNLVNTGLTPVINFFSNNMVAFTGAVILFATSVVRQMIPALGEMAEVAARKSEAVAASAARMSGAAEKSGQDLKKSTKALAAAAPIGKKTQFAKFAEDMIEGTASSKKFQKGMKSLDASITKQRSLANAADGEKRAGYLAQIKLLEKLKQKILEVQAAEKGESLLGRRADVKESQAIVSMYGAEQAAAVQNADGVLESFSVAKEGLKSYRDDIKESNLAERSLTSGGFQRIKKFAIGTRQSFTTAAVGARLFGIALVNAIPFIGQIIFIGGLLLGFLKNLFNTTNAVTEAQDKLNTVLDTLGEKEEQLDKQSKRLRATADATKRSTVEGQIYANTLKVQAGVTDEFTSTLIGLNNALLEEYEEVGLFGALYNFVASGVVETVSAGFQGLADLASSAGESISNFTSNIVAGIMEVDQIASLVEMTREFIKEQNDQRLLAQGLARATEAYNVLLDSQADAAKKVIAEFQKDGGIDGFLKKMKDEGKTAAQAIEELNKRLKDLGEEVNRRSGNIQELGTSFVELNQKLTTFREKLAQKDQFLELSKEIQNRVDLINSVIDAEKNEKDFNFAQVLAGQFESANVSLKDFGITLEDLQTRGTAPLIELRDKFKSISDQQNNIKQRQKDLNLDIALEKAKGAAANANVELRNMNETLNQFDAGGIPGLDYFDALTTAYSQASVAIETEFKNKKAIAALEYNLIEEKLQLEIILNGGDEARKQSLKTQLRIVRATRKTVMETLGLEEEAANARNRQTFIQGQVRDRDALVSSIENAETLADKIKIIAEATRNMGGDAGISDVFSIFDTDGVTKIADGARQIGEVIKAGLQPGIEEFKKLGPEGEVIATMLQGVQKMVDAFLNLGEILKDIADAAVERSTQAGVTLENLAEVTKMTTKEKAETALAVTATIAASLSALFNTMAAGTRNRIAHVDKEIEAEKKRDGKSKESVARIAALEKKREVLKRKEFDQKKKGMMAEVVMSTAMAIASTLPLLSNPVTAPLGIALMAMIGAMGAAQLAIISGMTYAGGGSASAGSGAGGTPTSVSAGQRRDSVDIAKSQSSRGEIAYMRGESGMGTGPENFRPAFGGYKNRAEGGNAAFMVGEQGPELFVPKTPGNIVPNDDIATGNPTNVTFNISAVDATGVEELLLEQRGNLIGMIREASNSYGQTFLEDIDTTVYTPQAGGVGRY